MTSCPSCRRAFLVEPLPQLTTCRWVDERVEGGSAIDTSFYEAVATDGSIWRFTPGFGPDYWFCIRQPAFSSRPVPQSKTTE